jgi:hypothetical protein
MTAVTSVLRDSSIITWRNLLNIRRIPDLLLGATVQPIMFVLLFAYVFAGSLGGAAYREFLIGGIFAQTVAFNAAFTTMGLANDLHKGIIDRFRSLPRALVALLCRTVEVTQSAGLIWLFPLTFISSAFVLTGSMPAVLKVAAEWNPVTAVADASRELFTNTGAGHVSPAGRLARGTFGALRGTVRGRDHRGVRTADRGALPPVGSAVAQQELPADCAVKSADLRTRQHPDRAGTLLPEADIGDRDAHQPQHGVPDLGEQPTHDVFATLVQHHFNQRLARHGLHDPESVDCRRAVVEVHSSAQNPTQRPRYRAGHFGQIGFEHPVGGVHQPVRQVPVVGQQQQTLGIRVETADVKQALRPVGHIVADTGSAAVVGHRGVHATRLVQRQVLHVGTQLQPHAIDVDDSVVGVDPHPHLAHHDPVDLDPAASDHLLGSTPGRYPCRSEHLVQPWHPGS